MNDKINNDGKEIQNIDNTEEALYMSEDNRNAIKEKLIKMEEYLQELQKYKPDNYQSYISDKKVKYAIERLLQLIIDLALDINNIVIKNEGGYPASDYFNSFIDLIELEVFTEQFARKIAPSTGLRNRLVHEYEKINNKIVYESIDETIDSYKKYMKNIMEYIKTN